MANLTDAETRGVHSAVDGVVWTLSDSLNLDDIQQNALRDALTELAGSILDLSRREQALR